MHVFHARDDVVVAPIMDHTAPCSQTAHFIADTVRALLAVNLVRLVKKQWTITIASLRFNKIQEKTYCKNKIL